jgi:hypothetical protein
MSTITRSSQEEGRVA